jgi:hypothetical protein
MTAQTTPHTASPRPGASGGPEAALENLAAALDDQDFDVTLNLGEGCPPSLTVRNRHAQLTETIYADGTSYWWPWAQPIAATGNPQAAATKISYVLGSTPQPSHG